MTNYFVVSVRGNPNYSQQTIADTLIRVYGKDFFKKLPIVKDSGMLRYTINRLARGQQMDLLLSESAHSRLTEMNEKLAKKGVVPPLVSAGYEPLDGHWATKIESLLVNKRLPRWFGSDKDAVYVHFLDADGDPFSDRVIHVGEDPIIYSIIKTLGIPMLLVNIGVISSLVNQCKITGSEFISSDWDFVHIMRDKVVHEDDNDLDPDDTDEDEVYIDDDLDDDEVGY